MRSNTTEPGAALFDVRSDDAGDDVFLPTEWSRGPWHPDHCHGGPVSALLVRSVERTEVGDVDWQVARLTVELLRPVRVGAALRLVPSVEREGRKVCLVGASLFDVSDADVSDEDDRTDERADEATVAAPTGTTEVARVRALRIRRAHIELPPHPIGDVDDLGEPGSGYTQTSTWALHDDGIAFHRSSCTHRWVDGAFGRAGPCRVWIRLDVPVVRGEAPSGLQRTAAAADFGNGVSGALPSEEFTYINPDLTIHVARPAVGDWIG
ncbi:MAG: acyl-CoA thioesterase domain-containing protein, partial [Actinomycetota bacterium]